MKGQRIEVTDWDKVMGKDGEIVCGKEEVREVSSGKLLGG